MLRQLELLRRTADYLADDLNRTMPSGWSCTIDNDFVLTLQNAEREESTLLERVVTVDNWPEQAWSDEYLESTLQDDATEMLCEEVVQILQLWDVEWPVCVDHDEGLGLLQQRLVLQRTAVPRRCHGWSAADVIRRPDMAAVSARSAELRVRCGTLPSWRSGRRLTHNWPS